jgi:hypothetical protein
LYVLNGLNSRINRIDVRTMTMVGGWSVAAAPSPISGALANGKIWFSFGEQWSTLASLDITTGTVTPDVGIGAIYAGADVAADDAADRIYLLDRGIMPSKIRSFDVSTGSPTPLRTSAHTEDCMAGNELTLNAAGTTGWTACGAPSSFKEWDLSTLGVPATTYPAQPRPNGIAVTSDGAYLAGSMWAYEKQVFLYAVDRPEVIKQFTTAFPAAGGMVAIAPGGSRVYVGTIDGAFRTFNLEPQVSSVTPARVARSHPSTVTLTGTQFSDVTAAIVGGKAVTPTVVNDTTLTLAIPNDLPFGAQQIVLTSRWGTSGSTPVSVQIGDLGPFATPDEVVTRLFKDLLGRAPSAVERSTWVADLLAERQTPATLVAALRNSSDHLAIVDPMIRLYGAYFLRTPDASGVTYWIGKRRTGTSEVQVSQSFVNSSEFKNRYGTLANRAFVEQVYRNVLGRNGDAGGITFWTKQLDTKARNRGAVMLGFSNSNEYVRTQAANVTASALHVLLLDRAPTAAEITSVATALSGGADVATLADAILRSPEYARRIG